MTSLHQTRTSLALVLSAVNAALYAGLGALWIAFPIVVFGIRFWPQVFVPAVFAVLFGPWVGGFGAAIGIFLADVTYGHHDALLSLLVGVPSNFVGFFLLGYLARREFGRNYERALLATSLLIPVALAAIGVSLMMSTSSAGISALLIVLIGASVVAAVALPLLARRMAWTRFAIAASIGLAVGSVIIGFGIVGFSAVFLLPDALGLGNAPLPFAFIYSATTFTFLSEIPFLILLTPPVVKAVRAALPALTSARSFD